MVLLLLVLLALSGNLNPPKATFTASPQAMASALPTPSNVPSKEAEEVVQNFYNDYLWCLGSDCDIQRSSFVDSTALSQNLAKHQVKDADPSVCAKTKPLNVMIDGSTRVDGDRAVVGVIENFGGSKLRLAVELLLKNGGWKIVNIVCETA